MLDTKQDRHLGREKMEAIKFPYAHKYMQRLHIAPLISRVICNAWFK